MSREDSFIKDLKNTFIRDLLEINKELDSVVHLRNSYIGFLEEKYTNTLDLNLIEEKFVNLLENYRETLKGSDGLDGLPGSNGLDGLHGRPGKDGTKGLDGLNGRDGKSLKFLGIQATHPTEATENDIYRNYSTRQLYIFNEGTWKDFLKDGEDYSGQSFYSGGGISDNRAVELISDYFRVHNRSNIVSATSNYIASNNDVVLCNGTFTVTVLVSSENIGRRVTIKNVSTGVITVSASSGTIDGEPTKTIGSQWTSIDVIQDGYNCYIL